MKRVFWSAIAMSLLLLGPNGLLAQTFLGLDGDDYLPELQGPNKFTRPEYQQNKEWNTDAKAVVPEIQRIKGQSYSQIDWKNQDVEEWLDINKWKSDREYRDKTPDWRQRLEDERNLELVGRILACHGRCHTYRGINSAEVTFRSQIKEGDEVFTEENSVAWIYLMDGSLARLGPNSAVGFQEINWAHNEVYSVMRIQKGHLYVHTRHKTEMLADTDPETDSSVLPLMLREANQEFFERELQRKSNDSTKLSFLLDIEKMAIQNQIELLNKSRKELTPDASYKRKYFVYAPNVTLDVTDSSFDIIHVVNGPSYFKRRDLTGEFKLKFRGHVDQKFHLITEQSWQEMEANGRQSSSVDDPSGHLLVSELLTKRIKTIELAREIWFREYSAEIYSALNDPKKLAVEYGYTFWKDGLEKRMRFIEEYTRRMETTNLKSLENLVEKLKESGENIQSQLSDSHYRASLNHYLLGLKKKHLNERVQIRDMNDLQYWVWILKNGKP